jgi:hypothetical protein
MALEPCWEGVLQNHRSEPLSPPQDGSAEAAKTPQAETPKPGRVSRELATIVIVAVLLVGIGAITLPLNMQAYLDAGTAFISLCSALIS